MHTCTYLQHAVHEEQWLNGAKLAQSCWWCTSCRHARECPSHTDVVFVTLVEIWWVGTGCKLLQTHGTLRIQSESFLKTLLHLVCTETLCGSPTRSSLYYWTTTHLSLDLTSWQFLASWYTTNMRSHLLRSCLCGNLCKSSWLRVVPGHVFFLICANLHG